MGSSALGLGLGQIDAYLKVLPIKEFEAEVLKTYEHVFK